MYIEKDQRFAWLSRKQRHLAQIIKDDGEVSMKVVEAMYASKHNWKNAIHKLLFWHIAKFNSDKTKLIYIPYETYIKESQTKLV